MRKSCLKWFNHEKNNYCTNKKEQVNLNWWNEKGNRETKNNINKSSKKSISKYDLKKTRMEKKNYIWPNLINLLMIHNWYKKFVINSIIVIIVVNIIWYTIYIVLCIKRSVS